MPAITKAQLSDQIDRLKKSECTLKNSNAKQLRIMIGDFTPFIVSDMVFPVKEFKAEYLKRIHIKIFELQMKVEEL